MPFKSTQYDAFRDEGAKALEGTQTIVGIDRLSANPPEYNPLDVSSAFLPALVRAGAEFSDDGYDFTEQNKILATTTGLVAGYTLAGLSRHLKENSEATRLKRYKNITEPVGLTASAALAYIVNPVAGGLSAFGIKIVTNLQEIRAANAQISKNKAHFESLQERTITSLSEKIGRYSNAPNTPADLKAKLIKLNDEKLMPYAHANYTEGLEHILKHELMNLEGIPEDEKKAWLKLAAQHDKRIDVINHRNNLAIEKRTEALTELIIGAVFGIWPLSIQAYYLLAPGVAHTLMPSILGVSLGTIAPWIMAPYAVHILLENSPKLDALIDYQIQSLYRNWIGDKPGFLRKFVVGGSCLLLSFPRLVTIPLNIVSSLYFSPVETCTAISQAIKKSVPGNLGKALAFAATIFPATLGVALSAIKSVYKFGTGIISVATDLLGFGGALLTDGIRYALGNRQHNPEPIRMKWKNLLHRSSETMKQWWHSLNPWNDQKVQARVNHIKAHPKSLRELASQTIVRENIVDGHENDKKLASIIHQQQIENHPKKLEDNAVAMIQQQYQHIQKNTDRAAKDEKEVLTVMLGVMKDPHCNKLLALHQLEYNTMDKTPALISEYKRSFWWQKPLNWLGIQNENQKVDDNSRRKAVDTRHTLYYTKRTQSELHACLTVSQEAALSNLSIENLKELLKYQFDNLQYPKSHDIDQPLDNLNQNNNAALLPNLRDSLNHEFASRSYADREKLIAIKTCYDVVSSVSDQSTPEHIQENIHQLQALLSHAEITRSTQSISETGTILEYGIRYLQNQLATNAAIQYRQSIGANADAVLSQALPIGPLATKEVIHSNQHQLLKDASLVPNNLQNINTLLEKGYSHGEMQHLDVATRSEIYLNAIKGGNNSSALRHLDDNEFKNMLESALKNNRFSATLSEHLQNNDRERIKKTLITIFENINSERERRQFSAQFSSDGILNEQLINRQALVQALNGAVNNNQLRLETIFNEYLMTSNEDLKTPNQIFLKSLCAQTQTNIIKENNFALLKSAVKTRDNAQNVAYLALQFHNLPGILSDHDRLTLQLTAHLQGYDEGTITRCFGEINNDSIRRAIWAQEGYSLIIDLYENHCHTEHEKILLLSKLHEILPSQAELKTLERVLSSKDNSRNICQAINEKLPPPEPASQMQMWNKKMKALDPARLRSDDEVPPDPRPPNGRRNSL